MSAYDSELEAVARELEAALGGEDLAKARYQMRMQLTQFVVGLLIPLVLAVLWLPTGWAVALRNALHANEHWWATWLALIVFMLVSVVVDLPVAWYFGFRLEERLGTNRQSFGGWLWDEIKETALNIPLQSALFLGLYLIFRRWPDRWLPGLIAVVVVFMAVFYLLSPVFLRMRYKTEPLDDPDLEARLRDLFARAGVRFGRLAVLKSGEKSSRGNAAVVPKGAGNEVVISDTLLEEADPVQVEVVIAHELGHKVHHDLLKLMVLMGVAFVVMLAVGYGVLQTLGTWDGLGGPADVATFPLLALTVAWLSAALQVLLNVYSRRVERAADAYALQMTDAPEAFEKVMVLLAQQNKSLPLPPRSVEFFFYNHPSIARRVLMARRWQRTAA